MGRAAELEDGDRRIASGKSAAKNRVAQKKYRDRQKEKMKLFEGQVEQLSKRLALLETENTSLGDRNRMLERLAQIVDEAPAVRHTDHVELNNTWDNKTSVALARFLNVFRRNKQPLLTAKEAATLPMAKIVAFKHDYVKTLGGLLLLAGDDPRSEHLEKVEQLVVEQRMARDDMVRSLSLRAVAQMMAEKECQPVVVTGFKESVVTVMQLQPDQKQTLLQAKAAALAELEVISRARAVITKEISRNEEASNPNGMCDAYIQGSAMATAMALEERFTESLAAEHHVLMQFYRACSEATTPVQEARALVEAYPEWFDMWLLPSYIEAKQQGSLPVWIQQNCSPCEPVPLHEPSGSASQADTCSAPPAIQKSAFQEAAGAPPQLPSSEASGDSTVLNDLDVQLETLPSLPADFALGLDNSELFDFLSLPSHINVTS